jgi:hypothetical protein
MNAPQALPRRVRLLFCTKIDHSHGGEGAIAASEGVSLKTAVPRHTVGYSGVCDLQQERPYATEHKKRFAVELPGHGIGAEIADRVGARCFGSHTLYFVTQSYFKILFSKVNLSYKVEKAVKLAHPEALRGLPNSIHSITNY